jgi:Sperm-tail PG-rich repeat
MYDDKLRKTLSKMGASLDRSNRGSSMNKTQAIIPGPGRYQPSTTDLMQRNYAPKYGFGTGGRPDLATGAPTNLNTSKRSLSDGKSTHSASPSRLNVPGPGAYNLK